MQWLCLAAFLGFGYQLYLQRRRMAPVRALVLESTKAAHREWEADMNDYFKGLLLTAVPLVVMGVVAGVMGSWGCRVRRGRVQRIRLGHRHRAAGARQPRLAAGVFTGLAIGVIALGVSCFASAATFGS